MEILIATAAGITIGIIGILISIPIHNKTRERLLAEGRCHLESK